MPKGLGPPNPSTPSVQSWVKSALVRLPLGTNILPQQKKLWQYLDSLFSTITTKGASNYQKCNWEITTIHNRNFTFNKLDGVTLYITDPPCANWTNKKNPLIYDSEGPSNKEEYTTGCKSLWFMDCAFQQLLFVCSLNSYNTSWFIICLTCLQLWRHQIICTKFRNEVRALQSNWQIKYIILMFKF